MAEFVAIAALDLGHILRLWALVGFMAFLVAVSAHRLSGFWAITSRVSLLATVEASSSATASLRAVLRKVTLLAAFSAFDICSCNARFGAVGSFVSSLTAVLAGEFVNTLLRA
ncbi:hypothetical protein F4861DRAFT_505636 [Xylaria intraflava]|nr:hypothetical protein F4861DRAFT_505636 [Xylaria intraflava]